MAYVNLQDVEILTEVDNVSWVDLQDFKILNVIEFPKEIEVLDGQENSPIAMIAAGEAYSIIEEDEQNYYIIIGQRQGAVAKDQLSETVEQPQSTEQTNDPETGTNQEAVEDEINEESTTKEQSNENQELTSDQKTNPDLKQENEETTKGQARLFTIQNQADSKTSDAAQQSVKFEKIDKYFEVLEDNLPVYDNRTGKLVKIGELKKGQVYPRVSDYGNWHRIQFSDYYGYVKKSETKPANGTSIKNENKSYKNSSKSFKAIENVTVYDNTSGKLVPFGTIEKGKEYKIASDYGNWWRIIFSGRIGYVQKSAVQLPFSQQDKYFEVLEDNLPVYDNRTGKLVKIGELKKGQVYPRVSDYGNWHRIQFSDYYGYVKKSETKPANGTSIKNENKSYKNSSKSFKAIENVTVYDNTSGKLVPFGTIEKGKEYKIASDYGNWWRIIFSDRVGYVRKSEVQLLFSQQDKYFEVLEDNLPVYDNRTGKLVKIGELKKGQVYPRVSDYGNWHRIQFSDYYGYVRKDSTRPANGSLIKNKNSSYKSNGRKITPIQKITVYDNSSGKLVPFGVIEKGKEYKIASDYGNWWLIVYSDRIGYVKKSEAIAEFYKNDRYFEVIKDNVAVYDNRTGKLVKVGELKKGQIYPRVSDYGNWHRIQFSDYYGYVQKSSTNYPTQKVVLPSENTQYTNSKSGFKATKTITVYDNKQIQGKLVPFGEITEGAHYQIAFDYGNWWGIIYAGRVGYVRKADANIKYTKYNRSFNELLNMQMKAAPQTDLYRNLPAYVSAYYIKDNKVTASTLNVREKPNNTSFIYGTLKKGSTVTIKGTVTGTAVNDNTKWYNIVMTWRNAKQADLSYYLNPDNFKSKEEMYQFLVLSKYTGIKGEALNKLLVGKGVLQGKGNAFATGASNHKINEVYLIAHALLETGNGTSTLAKGVPVKVKRDKNGNPIKDQNGLIEVEIVEKGEDKIVYNMFGINATDSCPVLCGAKKAYNEGWTTVDKAIIGGAKFVGQSYIHHPTYKQDTLYKMRWNPGNPNSYATHQYATDIGWAVKQAKIISNLYDKLDVTYHTFYDIPDF
ncbi:glucosaminidase domain-containing protein [Aeribacillus sp. FSL K6-8394]|uniref:glucosaminidase domain-containing protein n=1 Tax=Aeribacillus sp. FSL K6-8394 TaxID=2954570 RepID=UPI0030FB7592